MSNRLNVTPNDLSAFWMPFTANRQFKKAPRMLAGAKDMHYTTSDGRKVLDEYLEGEHQGIGIFLSVFDVHVNRAPLDGELEYSRHQDGDYRDARDPECSTLNEAQNLGFKSKWGPKYYIRQITGLIARRIVCPLSVGDPVKRGERFGMLKFGSRTELYFDNAFEVEWKVKVGDKVKGGGTVIAVVKVAGSAAETPENEEAVSA